MSHVIVGSVHVFRRLKNFSLPRLDDVSDVKSGKEQRHVTPQKARYIFFCRAIDAWLLGVQNATPRNCLGIICPAMCVRARVFCW